MKRSRLSVNGSKCCARGLASRRKRGLTLAVSASSLVIILGAGHAYAQADTNPTTPSIQIKDFLGVDIATDQYNRDDTYQTIGSLAWTYHGHTHYPNVWADYRGWVTFNDSAEDPSAAYIVHIGDNATEFSSSLVNSAGTGSTLAIVGSNYIFTDKDGTIYTFVPGSYTSNSLSTILRPNGEKLTLTYVSSGATIPSGSVVSNTGLAFKMDDVALKVYAVNMNAHSCDPTAWSCDAYDGNITIGNFVDGAGTDWGTVTDRNGNLWKYFVQNAYRAGTMRTGIVSRQPTIFKFQDPTGYAIDIPRTTTTTLKGCISSFSDPRGTFTWTRSYSGSTGALTVKDPAGATVYSALVTADPICPTNTNALVSVQDPLGHQTSYGISSSSGADSLKLNSSTRPEGNHVDFTYDGRGNVTQTVNTPKTGSGLSATTIYQAGYDAACSNLKTCNQPNWTRDAAGNQTDYTYDGTHGGVLTVTLPADQSGLRQRTYNTYTAYDTGNGYIYRLTRTENCGLNSGQLGNTSCSGIIPTSVTITDYGNSTTNPYMYKSFAPYQVTHTDGAGSMSATTSYAYDVVGNIVKADGPRTDVDDSSYKTYDASRRVIFEIGIDPDGPATGACPGSSGCLPRVMVKHTYDAANRETKTEMGTGNSTTGSDFTVASFTRMTYDTAGRLIKTEVVQP